MGKASFDQAWQVLDLIRKAEWDASLIQTFFGNWGSIRDLTVALHEGRLTPEQLKAVVEGRFRIVEPTVEQSEPAPAAFPTWKTITLGGQKDIAAYRAALQAGGYKVSDYASQLLTNMEVATTETTVALVRLTVREMGFPRGATTTEIYARIRELGLLVCPAEVGPALRLAYADQPSGEWIRVGMEPTLDSDGDRYVFRVEHGDSDRWLYADWTDPTYQWGPGFVWVFLRSQPAAASPQAMLAGKQ